MSFRSFAFLALSVAMSGAGAPGFADGGSPPAAPPQEVQREKDRHSHPSTHATVPAQPAPAAVETPVAGAVEKAVEEGSFPHSLQIPGTELSVAFGGYLKADVIQDFDAIGDATQFKTNTIPAEGTAAAAEEGRTTIQANETRLNLDLRSNAGFRAFVEGDFFGSSGGFRLRHAYGELRGLLAGQTWTTFQDISARPQTLDFEGPDGEVFVRQSLVRYTHGFSPAWKWAVAVENPTSQVAIPQGLVGSVKSDLPDFVTSLRHQGERSHFRAATIVRQIRFAGGPDVSDESAAGWGVNLSAVLKVGGSGELRAQYAVGDGISRYIESLSGQNADAVLAAADGLTTLPSQAAVVGYILNWTPKLRSGLAYSWADLDGESLLAGSSIATTQDVRVNLIHKPYELVEVGGELLWGRRENQDGTRGDAVRGLFSVIYHFN